jgi:hypothetical protein
MARGDEIAAPIPSLLLDADGRGGQGGRGVDGAVVVALGAVMVGATLTSGSCSLRAGNRRPVRDIYKNCPPKFSGPLPNSDLRALF